MKNKKYFSFQTLLKFVVILMVLPVVMASCKLLGLYFEVHNPKKPGKIPEFTEEINLLGEMTALRSCFKVHYYDLSVKTIPETKTLEGVVGIYANAVSDLDTFQLDLHPNLLISKLVDMETGLGLTYSRKERAVFVTRTYKKGDPMSIEITYAGKPVEAKKPPWNGGFVWKKDKEKNPWLGVACESEGASIWWPLKDHTSEEPDSIRLHYTVPKDLVAVGNGQLEKSEVDGDWKTFHWFVSYPINTYNVTIYVGDFKHFSDEYEGIGGQEMTLDYYVLPKNYAIAKSHFHQVEGILNVYEELYGEYPWYRDGFKLIESAYEGMEHQTAIAYGNGYENDVNLTTDYIILHEIAHEWWGNSVTAYDLSDVWIQEGFATYSEALYVEKMDGKEAYLDEMYWQRIMIGNKYPVIGIEGKRWFDSHKNSDVYGKGSWILHTLRSELANDSLFFDIIKSFYSSAKYKIVSSKDFELLVNEKTGKDYAWFFNQYLRNNFAPELEYKITMEGAFYYKWVNVNPDFNQMKLNLVINGDKVEVTPSMELQKYKKGILSYANFASVQFDDAYKFYKRTENKKL